MLKSADNMHWFWCMLYAGFIYIYMHAVCMFHVTCMDLGRFPCVLHACYMCATCMQESSIIDCFPKVLKLWISHRYMYICKQGRGQRNMWRQEIQNEYLCDIFSICSFLTCIKQDMFLTCNLHVTCLLFACYACCFCFIHCACYTYFNMRTTCILPVL